MHANQQLLETFYSSFKNKDYITMQKCYGDKATFNDEVFQNLNAKEVRAMWEMFCKRGSDLRIDFNNIKADEINGSAEWKATYTFSKTNRKVINNIKSKFIFNDGKIQAHTDHFNFYKWASQALGFPGILLGWTQIIKNKVRQEARKNLDMFMIKKMNGL